MSQADKRNIVCLLPVKGFFNVASSIYDKTTTTTTTKEHLETLKQVSDQIKGWLLTSDFFFLFLVELNKFLHKINRKINTNCGALRQTYVSVSFFLHLICLCCYNKITFECAFILTHLNVLLFWHYICLNYYFGITFKHAFILTLHLNMVLFWQYI